MCFAADSVGGGPLGTEAERSGFVGIDQSGLLAGLDEDVRASFAEGLAAMKQTGSSIVEVPFPSVDDLNICASVVTGFEVARGHLSAMVRRPNQYPAAVRRRLLTAACVSEADYSVALSCPGLGPIRGSKRLQIFSLR